MAGPSVSVRILFNRIHDVGPTLRKQASDVVKKAALDVEAGAKGAVPVRTGTLRRSIHTTFPSETSAMVGTDVQYAPHVEFGTRHMGARPYLLPAFERIKPKLVAALKAIVK